MWKGAIILLPIVILGYLYPVNRNTVAPQAAISSHASEKEKLIECTESRLNYDLGARRKTFSCELKLERHTALEMSAKTIADLRQCPGVLQIHWA